VKLVPEGRLFFSNKIRKMVQFYGQFVLEGNAPSGWFGENEGKSPFCEGMNNLKTLAGSSRNSGCADGEGIDSSFSDPSSVAFNPQDKCCYACEPFNRKIRKIQINTGEGYSYQLNTQGLLRGGVISSL